MAKLKKTFRKFFFFQKPVIYFSKISISQCMSLKRGFSNAYLVNDNACKPFLERNQNGAFSVYTM